jgi:hypothetical protein
MVGGIIKGVAALASLSIGGPAGAAIGYAVGHRRRDRDWRALLTVSERFRHTLHCWMLTVLDLDPVLRSASLIWTITPLRHQTL